MVSQKDIARKLNMTQQAVSAALRGDGGNGTVKVAPETRQRVLEMARQLGYRSNRYASILKGGKSQLIAIFHGPITNDWIPKFRAVNSSVEGSNYIPWLIEMARDEKGGSSPKNLDYVISAKVEGVVMAGIWSPWDPKWFWNHNVPVVSLHGRPTEGVPFFAPDKVDGFTRIIRHLYEQGCQHPIICRSIKASAYQGGKSLPDGYLKRDHRMVGQFVSGVESQSMMGFERYCGEAGVTPREPYYVMLPESFPISTPLNEFEHGRVLAREALRHRPDALVFTNDSMAFGGMYECQKAGLRVPEDILISGFNDEDFTRYSLVPITTMSQPVDEMTGAAVQKLLKMIEGRTLREDFRQTFRCQLKVRQSTRGRPAS